MPTQRSNKRHPIAFIDLPRQQECIRDRLDASIARVLNHGQYIMGPEVSQLEIRLAEFCGAQHAITCASGTDALVLALMAMGLRRDDAVIVPSFTFCATAEAVSLLGGVPIFADVLDETFNLDPLSLKRAILSAHQVGLALRGVITVDLFGQPCDYDAIEPVVRENDLWLICDAAQAFGATYRGRKVGTIGDITTTSFFPSKPLGCYGDGGAVFTNDDEIAHRIRSLRVHGQGENKYDNIAIGINGRLDTLQAAILLEKLAIFPAEIDARNRVAARYEVLPSTFRRPVVANGATSVWAQYTVQASCRGDWLTHLKERGIPVSIYYPRPLHQQTAYRHYPMLGGPLTTSERLAATALSLPMHPYLSAEDQFRIATALSRSRKLECFPGHRL